MRPIAPEPRVNRQIRISPIRLIGDEGEQLGVVAVDEALRIAEEKGFDLVEVAPTARPPVCKIMDYGKFKYDTAKKEREARKKQHNVQLKEIRYRPNIEDHDFDFKTNHVVEFLKEGNKVKVTVMFRGREMTHTEHGRAVLDRVSTVVGEQGIGNVESTPKLEGRNMSMIVAPKGKH
ncbi:MAG: translation initiation factor IF-3 [Gemmatimonadetes bacterium]|nr:translation initiation factor IF-3 [Gemmatimonadota bacterium]